MRISSHPLAVFSERDCTLGLKHVRSTGERFCYPAARLICNFLRCVHVLHPTRKSITNAFLSVMERGFCTTCLPSPGTKTWTGLEGGRPTLFCA